MKTTFFDSLLSLLVGASWALAIAGIGVGIYLFHPFGFVSTFFIAFVAALPGLLCVVISEIARLQVEKTALLKKQTKLLESIEGLLRDSFISHN
ncbi:MAG: hypothetical protein GX780_06050 [Campylobacteraceae bacterium]|nr:hypothetical protein [Campylobacteraceae bacterium]